jgi:hypothetical protein
MCPLSRYPAMVMMISFGRIGPLEGGSEGWISCIFGGLEGIVLGQEVLGDADAENVGHRTGQNVAMQIG